MRHCRIVRFVRSSQRPSKVIERCGWTQGKGDSGVPLQSKVLGSGNVTTSTTLRLYVSPSAVWTNVQSVVLSCGYLANAGLVLVRLVRGAIAVELIQVPGFATQTTVIWQGKVMLDPGDALDLAVNAPTGGGVMAWVSGQTYS
jgi:hypothetical protein